MPLLFAAVAIADVESEISGGRSPATLLLEEIGYGVLGGVVAGLLIAVIVTQAGRRNLIAPAWRQLIPAAGAALAYGIASALDGSGFIAAFVAGMVFRLALRRDPEELNQLTEEVGSLLNGVTFVLFGAILLGPALTELSWQLALYAVLSLTFVRMLPVVIAMWGSRARGPTLGFLGWFGPRGLASIVFAVIVIEESQLPHEHLIVLAIYLTVGLSVLAHGLTAAPLADRYARWYEQHPRDKPPPMESAPAEVTRPRGPRAHVGHERTPAAPGRLATHLNEGRVNEPGNQRDPDVRGRGGDQPRADHRRHADALLAARADQPTGVPARLGRRAGRRQRRRLRPRRPGRRRPDSTTSDTIAWGKIVFGALFLLLAARNWQHRPAAGA